MNSDLRSSIGARLERMRQSLRARGWDALWLGQSTNLRYLTGVVEKPSERLFGALIPASGDPLMLVPRMHQDEMKDLSAIDEVRSWTDEEGMAAAIKRHLQVREGGVIALDPLLQARFFFLLREELPGRQFVSGAPLLAETRLIKDAYEQERLRRAAVMADAVMAEITSRPLLKRREVEVAEEIQRLFGEQGSEGVSFPPIVSAGENAAFPHHAPDGTEIEPGACVVLDFGGVCEGYASDITRTVFASEPEPRMKHIYGIVREAQERAFQALRPEMEAWQADAAARKVIEEAGFGADFFHRLGHGIGLDVHEEPFLVAGNRQHLAPGVAFSVEPGIYRNGLGGVRIEDIVLMHEHGPERLNQAPRQLRIAGG